MDELGFMCFIALEEAVDIFPHQVERAFGFMAPRSTLRLTEQAAGDCEQALMAEVDGQPFAVVLIEGQLPEAEVDNAITQSIFWPEAAETFAPHTAYLAIAAVDRLTSHGLARAQAVALTKLAAALAEVTPSLGIYWRGAEACVPPGRVAEAVVEIGAGRWPVDMWLGYVMFGRDDTEHPIVGLQTRGAAAFLGFEVEIEPYAADGKLEPVRIVYNAVGYLMNFGDVIRDGQLVEVTGERRTSYRLLMGAKGKPGIARLSVLDVDHRKLH